MPTIPVYIAVLTSRKLSDILEVFSTEEAAIAQCHHWLRSVSGVTGEAIPGLCYWAQYGTQDETVRVERHMVELPDLEETWAPTLTLPGGEKLLHLDLDATNTEVPHG